MKIILQKYIAQSGYCSRRKAEELIKVGRIKVNGEVAEPGTMIGEGDEVKIDERKISLNKDEKIYIVLNKPAGYTCTTRKFEGEKNVFEILPKDFEGLNIAGRLDKDSRGLVLLTNDGDYLYELTHPKFGHEKEYGVNVKGQMSNVKTVIEKFKKGIDIGDDDGIVKAKEVEYLGGGRFRLVLVEGKKRQIRRMFEVLGLEVVDLQRIRINDIKLENLKEGGWKFIKP